MSPKSFRPPSASPTVGVRAPAPRESRAPSHKFRPCMCACAARFQSRVRCGRVRVDEVYDGMGGRTRLGALRAVLRARIAHEKILGQDRLKNNAPYRAQASGTREVCGFSRTPRPATRPCVACLRLRRLPSCDGSTQRAHLDSELRLRTRTSRESGGRRSRRECW
jgi:hypothetical protein